MNRADDIAAPTGKARARSLDFLRDVTLACSVELGRTAITLRQFLALGRGSVLELGRAAGEPAELRANGNLIARGEVVVVNDRYGLRVTEICEPAGGAD